MVQLLFFHSHWGSQFLERSDSVLVVLGGLHTHPFPLFTLPMLRR